jgi:glycosyltransferase involved in cell wall biosynthesis
MAPIYRTELIVKAFVRAKKEAPDLFLVLLEGPPLDSRGESYREQIKQIIKGSTESIKLVPGYIPQEVMSKYLKASDAVISIPCTDQRSTSVLEALASCPIVILSNIPPYLELQQEGYSFILLSEATEENLAKVMLAVQSVPLSTREGWLQANYKLIAEKENWEIQAAKIEGEYYALLERKHQTEHQRQ